MHSPNTASPTPTNPATAAERAVRFARRSFDGVPVRFYADGSVTLETDRLHERVIARGLSRELSVLVADDVCVYDASEVRGLIKAVRRVEAARRDVWARSIVAANAMNLRPLMRAFAARELSRSPAPSRNPRSR